MPNKISQILNELSYSWYWESNNKIIFDGEVWIQEVNNKLDKISIEYKWAYEKGKPTYYITQE